MDNASSDLSGVARLQELGTRLLLATMIDNVGVARVKSVPQHRFDAVVKGGLGWSAAMNVLCSDDGMATTESYGGPVGDMRFIPDMEAARPLDLALGLAWAPLDQFDQELAAADICQRKAVRRQEQAGEDLGFNFLVAFEIEFTLLANSGDPAGCGPGYGVAALLELERFSLDLLATLEVAGVEVETLHPEMGPGQLEVSLGPLAPLQAAGPACTCASRDLADRAAARDARHLLADARPGFIRQRVPSAPLRL